MQHEEYFKHTQYRTHGQRSSKCTCLEAAYSHLCQRDYSSLRLFPRGAAANRTIAEVHLD